MKITFFSNEQYIKDNLPTTDRFSFGDIMEPWVTQMNHPVVNIERISNGQVRLTQERFLYNPDSVSPDDTTPYG